MAKIKEKKGEPTKLSTKHECSIVANRLLTAMVIEMKNEISQTVRHCQAQAIINKLKDEHTL